MSLDACAGIVARGDPDRFLAAMTAPLAQRGDLLALYAFNVEVSRAPWVTPEPLIAEMRLQWWLDALDELTLGKTPRRHEVFDEISRIVRDHNLSTDLLTGLVTARRFDVHGGEP
ncbi:MAG: phytoene synthase, partial [Alphaproteobacteria bacterium HGW-Alphaproteobacteria-2]